jgi:hypothetical protein
MTNIQGRVQNGRYAVKITTASGCSGIIDLNAPDADLVVLAMVSGESLDSLLAMKNAPREI